MFNFYFMKKLVNATNLLFLFLVLIGGTYVQADQVKTTLRDTVTLENSTTPARNAVVTIAQLKRTGT